MSIETLSPGNVTLQLYPVQDSLQLNIAAGIPGGDGEDASITVGTVATLVEGSYATVANSGTTGDAILDFGIPRGAIPAVGWNFDTSTTDADPGNGDVRFNNATPASVTAIYFDNLDRDGNTVTSWLDSFDDSTSTIKGALTITPAATPSAKLIYNVTGSVVDGTGYRKVTVAHVAGTTLPSSGAHLGFTFSRSGNPGVIQSVVAGDYINVDATDPANPVISAEPGVTDGDKGDVTVSSSGAVWTIDNDVVTYAKIQNVSATARLLGRKTASAGDVEELTLTEALDLVGSAAQGDILYRGASSWSRLAKGTALQVLRQNTALTAPEWSTAREVMTSNRTYYVRTDGNNSNDGLTDSSGGAFLTLAKAIAVAQTLDLNGFSITIQVSGAGASFAGFTLSIPFVGGNVKIAGNTGTPSTYTVTSACTINPGCKLQVEGLKIVTSGHGFYVDDARLEITGAMDFGACTFDHITAANNATVLISSNYNVTGNGRYHWAMFNGARLLCQARTISIAGARTFTTWARAEVDGSMVVNGNTYSIAVSVTGTKFEALNGGTIETYGGSTSAFPGSVAGSGTNYGTSPYGRYG